MCSRTTLPSANGAQLDQVADLVAQPQAVAAGLAAAGRWRPASGSAMRPPSATSQTSAPSACQMRSTPRAAAVADRVGRHLVDGEHEVAGPRRGEARAVARAAPTSRRTAASVPAAKASSSAPGGGAGSGSVERGGDRAEVLDRSRCSRGAPSATTAGWLRCAFVDHVGRRARRRRTGTAARSPGVGEGEVEQRLVALALDELVGAALRPDRLADAAQPAPAPGVGVDELAPRGDDARRVGADLGHVGEGHVARRRLRAPRAGARSSRR